MSKEDVIVKHECPKCGGNLEIGYLPGAFSWSAGESLWSIKKPSRIFAYRFENCGYVEFYTEKKKE